MKLSTKRLGGLKNLLRYAAYTIYGFFVVMGVLATVLLVWGLLEWLNSEVKMEATPDTMLLSAVGILIVLLLVTRVVTKNYLLNWCLCALFSAGICIAMGIWTFRQYGFGIDIFGSKWEEVGELSKADAFALLFLLPTVVASVLCLVSSTYENRKRIRLSDIGDVVMGMILMMPLMIGFVVLLELFLTLVMTLCGAIVSLILELLAMFLSLIWPGIHEISSSDLNYFGYLVSIWCFMVTISWCGLTQESDSSSYSSYSGSSSSSSYSYTDFNGNPTTYEGWHAMHDELDAVQDSLGGSGWSDGV